MELSGKEDGMTYALITGIQKIKLAGAEKRAFARWGNLYAENARLAYSPPMFIRLNSVISLAISLAGTIIMYVMAVKSGISVADYYAFDTAYGMVSGAFASLAGIALAFQLFTYIICLYFAFGNENGFLTEKGTKIFCNIVHNGFFNVNKSKHKTCFSGIFPVFINVSAFLYAERKRHLI